MATTNFYFGLLDFYQSALSDFDESAPNDIEERRRENLFEYVNQSRIVFHEPQDDGEDAVWRFGRCEKVDGLIIGRYGKNFTEEQTQWDDDTKDYVKEREEIEVADVSHFVIFPIIPGIVFNRKLRIGPNQFKDAFVGGYNASDTGGKIEMSILRTGGELSFEDVVSNAEKVRKVDFDLEPTNPYPDEDMEILDDHIRAMNAEDFKMVAEAKEDESLNPEEDFIRSGAALSEGNYGNYVVELLTEDGEELTYNSRGERAREELPEPETVGGLKPYLNDLMNRIEELLIQRSAEQEAGPELGNQGPEDSLDSPDSED